MGRISCRWKPEKNYLQSLIEVKVEELAHDVLLLLLHLLCLLLLPLCFHLHPGVCLLSAASRQEAGAREEEEEEEGCVSGKDDIGIPT